MMKVRWKINFWDLFFWGGVLFIPLAFWKYSDYWLILEASFLCFYILSCPKGKIFPFLRSDRRSRFLFFGLSCLLYGMFLGIYSYFDFLGNSLWPFIFFWCVFGLIFFIGDVKQRNFVKTVSFTLAQILGLPIFFVGSLFWLDVEAYLAREKFDPKAWSNYTEYKETAHSSVRLRMLDDLLDNYNLEKKNKSEIIKLLGALHPEIEMEHCYYLGGEGGFASIDENLFLCFDFDSEQKVESVYQQVFR